jgi:hypothetical protein
MFARPNIREAELLGLDRRAPDRLRPSLTSDMGQMDTDLHHGSSRFCASAAQVDPKTRRVQGPVPPTFLLLPQGGLRYKR